MSSGSFVIWMALYRPIGNVHNELNRTQKKIMQKITQDPMQNDAKYSNVRPIFTVINFTIHWAIRLIINTEWTFIYDNNHGNDCNNASFWTHPVKSLTANHINIDRSWANRILPNDSRITYSIPIFRSRLLIGCKMYRHTVYNIQYASAIEIFVEAFYLHRTNHLLFIFLFFSLHFFPC